MGSLPNNIPVDIDDIVEVENRGPSPISPTRKTKRRK
jgi:hypothetical protein